MELPSGRSYELAGKVEHGLAVINQAADLRTLWAVFPNPNNVLIPGLEVRVISRLTDESFGQADIEHRATMQTTVVIAFWPIEPTLVEYSPTKRLNDLYGLL